MSTATSVFSSSWATPSLSTSFSAHATRHYTTRQYVTLLYVASSWFKQAAKTPWFKMVVTRGGKDIQAEAAEARRTGEERESLKDKTTKVAGAAE